jgi:hypothetical protein
MLRMYHWTSQCNRALQTTKLLVALCSRASSDDLSYNPSKNCRFDTGMSCPSFFSPPISIRDTYNAQLGILGPGYYTLVVHQRIFKFPNQQRSSSPARVCPLLQSRSLSDHTPPTISKDPEWMGCARVPCVRNNVQLVAYVELVPP